MPWGLVDMRGPVSVGAGLDELEDQSRCGALGRVAQTYRGGCGQGRRRGSGGQVREERFGVDAVDGCEVSALR